MHIKKIIDPTTFKEQLTVACWLKGYDIHQIWNECSTDELLQLNALIEEDVDDSKIWAFISEKLLMIKNLPNNQTLSLQENVMALFKGKDGFLYPLTVSDILVFENIKMQTGVPTGLFLNKHSFRGKQLNIEVKLLNKCHKKHLLNLKKTKILGIGIATPPEKLEFLEIGPYCDTMNPNDDMLFLKEKGHFVKVINEGSYVVIKNLSTNVIMSGKILFTHKNNEKVIVIQNDYETISITLEDLSIWHVMLVKN